MPKYHVRGFAHQATVHLIAEVTTADLVVGGAAGRQRMSRTAGPSLKPEQREVISVMI